MNPETHHQFVGTAPTVVPDSGSKRENHRRNELPRQATSALQPGAGGPRDRLLPTVGKEGTRQLVPGFFALLAPPLASKDNTNRTTEAGRTPSPLGLTSLFSIRPDLPLPGTTLSLPVVTGR